MTTDEAAKAVAAAAQARAAALVAADRQRLAALLHPQLRWTTYQGLVLNREEYLAGNVDGDLVWIEQTLHDLDIQVIDDTVATLTALVDDVVNRDGSQETLRLRLTQTWIKTPAGWVCLSGHAGPRMG